MTSGKSVIASVVCEVPLLDSAYRRDSKSEQSIDGQIVPLSDSAYGRDSESGTSSSRREKTGLLAMTPKAFEILHRF
jgi:hypothetical protein